VTDPVKQGEGVGAWVSYQVRTKSTHRRYVASFYKVVRRFRDFAWLHDKLVEKNKGFIVPPLPEKSAVQKYQMATEFIDQRRRALQVFVNRVACHPTLKDSKELETFLQADEEQWMLEIAKWQAETSAQHRPVSAAAQWFKNLHHSAQSLVSGRAEEIQEDPEYIKIRDYVNSLEAHLMEAHRQAARLMRKEADLGTALSEFATSAEALGKWDNEGPMRAAFDCLFSRAGEVAALSRARSEAMAVEFAAPLKEFARTIKAVQAAMADRTAALSAYSLAKSDLDLKKVRLAKLRGTPGLKEDKIAETERDVNEADQRLRNTKHGYETIRDDMREELNRFQKERAAEMTALLRDFALAQAHHTAEQAKAWGELLREVQQATAGNAI
ncbi:Sorting nexin 1, partial [Tetrabaena socialis]